MFEFPSPLGDPYIQIQEKDHRFVQLCFRPLSEILIFKFTQREVSELAKDVFPSPLGDPYIQITTCADSNLPVTVSVPSRRSLYSNSLMLPILTSWMRFRPLSEILIFK